MPTRRRRARAAGRPIRSFAARSCARLPSAARCASFPWPWAHWTSSSAGSRAGSSAPRSSRSRCDFPIVRSRGGPADMRLLAILLAVIQFTFAFHAVRTGRGAKWVMIIVLAPVVGCLAYYFIEVFPDSREERQLRRHVRDIARTLDPDGELKRRTEEVQL